MTHIPHLNLSRLQRPDAYTPISPSSIEADKPTTPTLPIPGGKDRLIERQRAELQYIQTEYEADKRLFGGESFDSDPEPDSPIKMPVGRPSGLPKSKNLLFIKV